MFGPAAEPDSGMAGAGYRREGFRTVVTRTAAEPKKEGAIMMSNQREAIACRTQW